MLFRKTLRAVLLGSGAATALAASPMLAAAGEIDDLKTQIDTLQSHLDQLEKQQAVTSDTKVAPADAVVGGDFPGSFKLPGSDTSVAIHGYTKVDFIYDFDASLGDSFVSTGIPGNSNAASRQDGAFRFHARQSRFSFETRTPTDWGQMKTYISLDFFGAAGSGRGNTSNAPRMREAYGVLGPVLAGQTWSNFDDVEDQPETLDFNGPQGASAGRQAQIRYTQVLGKFTLSGSLENPQAALSTTAAPAGAVTTGGTGLGAIGTTSPVSGVSVATMPDITARAQYTDTWGHLSLSGVLRRFALDNGGDPTNTAGPTTNLQKDQWAGGGIFSGTVNVGELLPVLGKDQAGFAGDFGRGIDRYFQLGSTPFGDGVITGFGSAAPQLFVNTNYGGFIWYQHFWTDQLRSTVAYGSQSTDWQGPVPNVAGAVAGNNAEVKRAQSIHANLIWSPVKAVNVGLEFMWGEDYYRNPPNVDLPGGNTGDAKRLMASMQYVF
ncbi:MAG TPA: DcaP family trimeric outer membrane transporter [Alphaproteobacteria bacterium]|nr:DcaP family trimeric outer membrane transporter [Alphaproteobacteria bacterium]